MVNVLEDTEFIREDTKELIAYAEAGESPCDYCKSGAKEGCVNSCRAWPIWFSVRWRKIQEKFKR